MDTQATMAVAAPGGLAAGCPPGGFTGLVALESFPAAELAELEQFKDPSRLKLEPLLAVLPDWLFVVRADGLLLQCYAPTEHGEGAPRWVGKRLVDLLPPTLSELVAGYLETILATGRTHSFACQHIVDGRLRDFQVRATPHGLNQVLALVRDVSERKLLEREVLEISNREQMRIGQDLHDTLGQHLTGITFLTRALEKKLAAQQLSEADQAAEIGELVLQALAQTRNLARGLFPVELESIGLAQALRDLAATVGKCFDVQCLVLGDETVRVADGALAQNLFRIAQEALSNAVRHGKARQVVLTLRQIEDKLLLSVQDDGLGFPSGELRPSGLGLRIMQYRAQRVHGSLEIRRVETGGTVVQCLCPNPQGSFE